MTLECLYRNIVQLGQGISTDPKLWNKADIKSTVDSGQPTLTFVKCFLQGRMLILKVVNSRTPSDPSSSVPVLA